MTQVITHLVNGFGLGGTERQLVEALRQLRGTGYEADLCCLSKEGEFLFDVAELGLTPPEFHLKGSLLQPNTLVQVMRLVRRVRATGSRLVHCHDFYSNLVGSLVARLAGVPVIVSRRDLGAWVGPRRALVLRTATRRATRVLCNARAIRDRLVTEGVAPERIEVVQNGIDLVRFDARAGSAPCPPLPELAGAGPVVIVVANMKSEGKGHAEVVEAAALVAREHPAVRFLLVGDGALRGGLEERVRALRLERNVIFAGRRTDVPALLRRSTVAVLASHSEGFPNAVMEAMAARLPVVATPVGGVPELVIEGGTGYLVPVRDVRTLARRLCDVLDAPLVAKRMGRAGRAKVERELGAHLLGTRLVDVYERTRAAV